MKQLSDVTVALLGISLFSPFSIVCMFLVWFTSRVLVFHISKRTGATDKHVNIIKSRTMWIDAPKFAAYLLKEPKSPPT